MLFRSQVEDVGWYVIQLIPEKNLNVQVFAINLVVFVSILFCLIFGVIFSIFQNNSIIRPIKRLMKEMIKVKTGDFNVTLPIRSNDEIGKLSSQFVDMTDRVKDLINKVFKSQIKEREAELIAMQAQINPHFLYNTLDNIRWMAVNEGANAAGEQIEALSRIFRHVLNKGKETTTVRDELMHLRDYIFIQENRFKDTIRTDIQLDDSLIDCETLKLILQPLVENSYQHSLQRKVGGGFIHVGVEKEGESIRYTVTDDGLGADEEKIRTILYGNTESGSGFALKNIHDRIQLKYGQSYGLVFSSEKNKGTTVTVTFPYRLASKAVQEERT